MKSTSSRDFAQRPQTALQNRRNSYKQSKSTYKSPQPQGKQNSQGPFFLGQKYNNEDYSNIQMNNFKPVTMPNTSQSAKTFRDLGFINPSMSITTQNMSKTMASLTSQTQANSQIQKSPEKRLSYDYPVVKNIQRIVPKLIPADKEKLYEELLVSKSKINMLTKENKQVHTRCAMLEEQYFRYGKFQDDFSIPMPPETKKPAFKSLNRPKTASKVNAINTQEELTLIMKLKEQIKDQIEQLRQKDKTIENMKKMVKITQLQELKCEVKAYKDEVFRLRNMLQIYHNRDYEINQNKYQNN